MGKTVFSGAATQRTKGKRGNTERRLVVNRCHVSTCPKILVWHNSHTHPIESSLASGFNLHVFSQLFFSSPQAPPPAPPPSLESPSRWTRPEPPTQSLHLEVSWPISSARSESSFVGLCYHRVGGGSLGDCLTTWRDLGVTFTWG